MVGWFIGWLWNGNRVNDMKINEEYEIRKKWEKNLEQINIYAFMWINESNGIKRNNQRWKKNKKEKNKSTRPRKINMIDE